LEFVAHRIESDTHKRCEEHWHVPCRTHHASTRCDPSSTFPNSSMSPDPIYNTHTHTHTHQLLVEWHA
jgi:hypothetical protein